LIKRERKNISVSSNSYIAVDHIKQILFDLFLKVSVAAALSNSIIRHHRQVLLSTICRKE